jgi:hypothetical protein
MMLLDSRERSVASKTLSDVSSRWQRHPRVEPSRLRSLAETQIHARKASRELYDGFLCFVAQADWHLTYYIMNGLVALHSSVMS